jgi:uncharacterized membrane protein YeaQ/YmgE (transglycosylase-associated protein family)
MLVLTLLIIGLIVGSLARLLMPSRDPGLIVTLVLAVAGSIGAWFMGRAVGWYRSPGSTEGVITAVAGALLGVAIYRLILGPRRLA